MSLTILIALFGNVFLLTCGALTSPNDVTQHCRVNSAQFSNTLANTSQSEIDFLCNSISLTDFFFQFVIQYKPQTLFCSSAILAILCFISPYYHLLHLLLLNFTLLTLAPEFLHSGWFSSWYEATNYSCQHCFNLYRLCWQASVPAKQDQSWSGALQD